MLHTAVVATFCYKSLVACPVNGTVVMAYIHCAGPTQRRHHSLLLYRQSHTACKTDLPWAHNTAYGLGQGTEVTYSRDVSSTKRIAWRGSAFHSMWTCARITEWENVNHRWTHHRGHRSTIHHCWNGDSAHIHQVDVHKHAVKQTEFSETPLRTRHQSNDHDVVSTID